MNLEELNISSRLVPANYLKAAANNQRYKAKAVKELLEKRKLPYDGWTDVQIEDLIRQIAALDTNNFHNKISMGEREGLIISGLVARRHYGLAHGIGRSGDILASQPKAAGSTLMANLTNALLRDLMLTIGLENVQAFLMPMATGMTLTLSCIALKKRRPKARFVLWSRIDHESCFKSITTAGLTPIIIEPRWDATSGFTTDVASFEEKIAEHGAENIVCLYTTTSCFAPRNCDDIVAIGILAKQHNIPHLINNAYGLWCKSIKRRILRTSRVGRIDLFVQSTDKNLMVPVGGAVVAGFDEEILHSVAKSYPGRSSSSQTLDVLMTLLTLGKSRYMEFIEEREKNFEIFLKKLKEFAAEHNERVIESNDNHISVAMTLSSLSDQSLKSGKGVQELGSMLYSRNVFGMRVVVPGVQKIIDGYNFSNWGTHHSEVHEPYIAGAVAIGSSEENFTQALNKLRDSWHVINGTSCCDHRADGGPREGMRPSS